MILRPPASPGYRHFAVIFFMICVFSGAGLASSGEQYGEQPGERPKEQPGEQPGAAAMVETESPFLIISNETAGQQSNRRFSFEFRNDPLDVALYRISHTTGADIIYESLLTKGVMVSAVFRDQPLGSILDDLLRPAGLEARRIRTGMYVVRYSLRRSMEPISSVTGAGDGDETPARRLIGNPGIRSEDRIRTRRDPVPLRERPFFWIN